jgi:hypothetical protein
MSRTSNDCVSEFRDACEREAQLAAQPQDRDPGFEIAGASVPAIMGVAATCERGVTAE